MLHQYPPRPLIFPAHYRSTAPPTRGPSISIVTPNLNNGRFLESTIQSVLGQGYGDLEYIVQDGGSSDVSVEILKRYESLLTHWESRPDGGQTHGLNRGLNRTNGEIMAYLNSDDLLVPGALNFVADFFNRRPDVDVVYGHRIIIDENGKEVGRWLLPPHNSRVLQWDDYVPQESLFWRRRIWEEVGGKLDEQFQFAMDWDLILRFMQAGANFVRIPRFLAVFRLWPGQKTSSQYLTRGLEEITILRERIHGKTGKRRKLSWTKYMMHQLALSLLWEAGFLNH